MVLACLGALILLGCSYDPSPGSPRDATGDSQSLVDAPPPDTGDASPTVIIEAEAATLATSADATHLWTIETTDAGFSGTGYVTALPDDTNNCNDAADQTCGALNRYDFTISIAGTYRVTLRHRSPNGGSDSLHWYLTATGVDLTRTEDLDPDVTIDWTDDTSTTTVTLPVGPASFLMRMREPGAKVDQIRFELE